MPKNLNSSNRHDQDLSEQMNVQMNIYEIELPSSDETSFTNEDFESSSQQTCEDDSNYEPDTECDSQGPPAKKRRHRTRSSNPTNQETDEDVGSSSSDHDSDVEQDEPGILDADIHHAGFFLPLFASLHKL